MGNVREQVVNAHGARATRSEPVGLEQSADSRAHVEVAGYWLHNTSSTDG